VTYFFFYFCLHHIVNNHKRTVWESNWHGNCYSKWK